jgi:hypothetical protein
MKVKELINKLLEYNMEAEVKVIAHSKEYNYSITFGGAEVIKNPTTKEVSLYVDELCTKETI